VQDGFLRALIGNGDRFQRRQRHIGRGRIAEGDVIELDGGGTGCDGHSMSAFPDHGRKIADFEDPLERD
jgi:hypothetical protein